MAFDWTKFWQDVNDLAAPNRKVMTTDQFPGIGDVTAGLDPLSPPPSSRGLSYDQFVALAQKRDRGLQIFDVNPSQLTASNFQSQVPLSTIYDKIGYTGDGDGSGYGGSFDTDTAWRTVAIPLPGNFLKFEYLQSQLNVPDSSVLNAFFKEPNYDFTFGASTKRAVIPSKIVFIQFDDPNGPLHVLKNGDVFKTAYNAIFITTKTINSRFSIVIGRDSEIISSPERHMLADMAMGPGYGLWEAPHRHCVPFCIAQKDQTPSGVVTPLAGSLTKTLFTPVISSSFIGADHVKGAAVLWITNIQFTAMPASTNTNVVAQFILYIGGDVNDGFAVKKLIATVPIMAPKVATGGLSGGQGYVSFSPPIRVVLNCSGGFDKIQECLNYNIINSSADSIDYYWSVNGYAYGLITKATIPSFNWNLEATLDTPYPCDMAHDATWQL